MSWKQRKQAYGKSNRLKRLADELSKADMKAFTANSPGLQHPWAHYDYDGLNEKDNTSASETSKSQNMDGLFAPNANTRPNRASRPARHQSRAAKPPSSGFNSAGKPFEDDCDADAMASAAIDAQNQTVSELLSMLSGSCESH